MANQMQIKLQTLLPIKWHRADELAFPCRLNGIRPINWPFLLPIKRHSADELATPKKQI
jgi:hypothetical protein